MMLFIAMNASKLPAVPAVMAKFHSRQQVKRDPRNHQLWTPHRADNSKTSNTESNDTVDCNDSLEAPCSNCSDGKTSIGDKWSGRIRSEWSIHERHPLKKPRNSFSCIRWANVQRDSGCKWTAQTGRGSGSDAVESHSLLRVTYTRAIAVPLEEFSPVYLESLFNEFQNSRLGVSTSVDRKKARGPPNHQLWTSSTSRKPGGHPVSNDRIQCVRSVGGPDSCLGMANAKNQWL